MTTVAAEEEKQTKSRVHFAKKSGKIHMFAIRVEHIQIHFNS